MLRRYHLSREIVFLDSWRWDVAYDVTRGHTRWFTEETMITAARCFIVLVSSICIAIVVYGWSYHIGNTVETTTSQAKYQIALSLVVDSTPHFAFKFGVRGGSWVKERLSEDSDIYDSTPYLVYKVQVEGNFWKRLKGLNEALCRVRELMRQDGRIVPRENESNQKIVVIGRNNSHFMKQLANFSQVSTLILPYQFTYDINATVIWTSFKDTSNLLIQRYYTSSGDHSMCHAANTLMEDIPAYGNPCRVNITETMSPTSIHPSQLQWIQVTGRRFQEDLVMFAGNVYKIPPKATLYVHIIQNAIVTKDGDIFSDSMKYATYGCKPNFLESRPKNCFKRPILDEVFVVSQVYGNAVFHRMTEVIARLVTFADFLRQNVKTRIHAPHTGGQLAELLNILNISRSRLLADAFRAKIAFVPKAETCAYVYVREIQILSRTYRRYIDKKFPNLVRNRIILIRRSRHRIFGQQKAIQSVIRRAASDYNLTYTLYIDNPSPALRTTMKWFNSAVMVIGPHGAGFSNLIFSRPETYIIEGVCHWPFRHVCYKQMSHVLGHHWHGILSRPGCPRTVNVDVSKVEFAVRELLRMWFQGKK